MTQSIQIDGHRLIARCNETHDLAARSMLQKFASLHAKGPSLHPGSRIDFGWAVLQIEAEGEDWLVCEPDFDSEPMRWQASVEQTLAALKAQASLIGQLGVKPRQTRGDQMLWLAPDALDAPRVYLHRGEPSAPEESGWYIGRDREPDEPGEVQPARRVRAGCLLSRKPEWVAVLALPANYLAIFEDGEIAAIYDDLDRPIYHDREDAANDGEA
jgi:hypothetical protein